MSKYIDADKLIAGIERRKDDHIASIEKYFNKKKFLDAEIDSWRWAECKWFLSLIDSLQQEQTEPFSCGHENSYDEAYLQEKIAKASKTWEGVDADKYLDEVRGREQEQSQVADASKMEPEVELEKASRNVYESWKGGTMDDFLRDMVELGKALNARKEE